jgi:hypothetical protein
MSKNQPSKTSNPKATTLVEALEVLANHFEMTETKMIDSVPTQVNVLAYAQKRILDGILYSACLTLKRTQDDLDAKRADVKAKARSHRGDELSELALNRAIDWLERLELQEATLASFIASASATYEARTGVAYVPPVMKAQPKAEFSTPAMQRAARFGIGSPEVPQSAGVEAA